MKKIFAFLIILILPATLFAANLVDVFPSPSELPGGSSGWFATDVIKTQGDRFVIYEKNYTFYSEKKERILDIERNNTYSASVRIFACDNLEISQSKYSSLITVDEKIVSKKMSNPAPFGERGMLLALPSGKTSADFYITFILGAFVVQVYSDDGFAQIDVASEIEKRLKAYMKKSGISFYMNKINIETTIDGETYYEQALFPGDDVAVVVLDGKVFGADYKPVQGAKIKVRETGQETVTDNMGAYSIEVTSAWGKAIYLSKMIFLDIKSGEKPTTSGVYRLVVKDGKKERLVADFDLFFAKNSIIGKYKLLTDNETVSFLGNIKDDNITFVLPCVDTKSPQCRHVFKGSVADYGLLKGRVIGGGLNGDWVADKNIFSLQRERKYIRDAGLVVKNQPIFLGYTQNKWVDVAIINQTGKNDADHFYFKKAEIVFKTDNMSLEKGGKLILSEVEFYGKEGEIFSKNPQTVATFEAGKSYESVTADISITLRNPKEMGYMLAIFDEALQPINFSADIENSYAELYYFRDTQVSKPKVVVEGSLKAMAGEDFVSNASKIRPDGEGDLVLTLNISLQGRVLEGVEVAGSGGFARRWNTNPLDIYPVVALVKDDKIINSDDGSIHFKLNNETETFQVNIYKGSFAIDEKSAITIKVTIDGKVYATDPIEINNIEEKND